MYHLRRAQPVAEMPLGPLNGINLQFLNHAIGLRSKPIAMTRSLEQPCPLVPWSLARIATLSSGRRKLTKISGLSSMVKTAVSP
jgi:hypothetical protein